MVKPKFLAALEDLLVLEKGAVVSKQQLSDEFLNGYRACEETPRLL